MNIFVIISQTILLLNLNIQILPSKSVLDIEELGVSRNLIFQALEAEGISGLAAGYSNIHLLPLYQNKIAYGSNGFPWNLESVRENIDYSKGICPVAERLHEETFLGFEMCLHELSNDDVNLMITAFKKVWSNLTDLKDN